MYLKYTSSLHWNTDLILQNVLRMYFFCQNNIDLKYTSSSVIWQVEVYLKYIWSMLLYLNILCKYTSSIFEVYLRLYFTLGGSYLTLLVLLPLFISLCWNFQDNLISYIPFIWKRFIKIWDWSCPAVVVHMTWNDPI